MTTRAAQEEIIFRITGAFEGHGYGSMAGNFDAMGWSIGFLQWNFGQGTLQRLFLAMHKRSQPKFEQALTVMHDGRRLELYRELLAVCMMKKDQAVIWADQRSRSSDKRYLVGPWPQALTRLLAEPLFQAIQREFAAPYVRDARQDCVHFKLETLRDLALFFDISVQNGPAKVGQNIRADVLREFRALGGYALSVPDRRRAIVEAVAKTSRIDHKAKDPFWIQNDVRGRKMLIVNGKGQFRGSFWDLEAWGLSDEPIV